jgi:tetratricopeptide (TPR) repeat protein
MPSVLSVVGVFEVNMTALSARFAAALQYHQAGDVRQAEETCRHILKTEPTYAPALHLLGVLAQQAGRNEEALPLLRQAVVLCPGDADYHYNLGVVQQVLGRSAEAIASYREALRLHPDHVAALNNLGQLALNRDQLAEAETCLRHALRVEPNYGAAYHNLALVCKRRGKIEEAVAYFRQAVRLCPENALIHYQLGLALEECGQVDEALAAFREAVRLQPGNALFHCQLGNLLTLQHYPAEALPHYEQALRSEPDAPAHHSNLGNVLTQLGRPQEAEAHCRKAIQLQADFVNAYHNLANALAAQGRLDEALQSVEHVLRLNPNHAGARHCRALWRLQQGHFAEGWPEYEWRWKLPDMVGRPCREPLWDGSPLNGRTILLWAEQGLGDTLQAIRFAPLVKQRGGTVVVECQAPLVPLLSRCAGIDRLVPRGSPAPAVDVQAPLMSLPWLLGVTLETLPAEVPYLFADPALVERWRRELEGPPSFKIGIAWQGNPLYSGDSMRSIPLKHFAALARLPGIRLFSLQKGIGSEQRQAMLGQFYVVDLGCRLDETTGAFMDTAAVLQNLDLVVTSDTSVAHLAGGMGVPVWVALTIGCDWRFFQHRHDNPWYPTMRLFRQTRFGDWDEVFARMAEELARRVASVRERITNHSPADLAQRWERALAHFQAGEREAAERICHELLDAEPCHAEALNLLGVLAHTGWTERAGPAAAGARCGLASSGCGFSLQPRCGAAHAWPNDGSRR